MPNATCPERHIAIFGGAFDPPHLGHVLCACYAKLTTRIDQIWVLPSAVHPYGKAMRPFADRLQLCRLAFAELPFVQVRTDEQHNSGGRTIDLVEQLSQTHPHLHWHLVGGTDTERDLPHWYRGKDLSQRVQIIVIPRRGYDDQHPAALPAISSTLVRERIAQGLSCTDLIPHPVAQLIADQGWYRS
jgi:nicotinate-nucleotide adenylyltransferase